MGVGIPSMPQSSVKGAKSEMQEVIDYTVHKQYERHKLIYQRVGRPNSEFEDK